MSRRSTLAVIAAGVVAAAFVYHDWWTGGPTVTQESFRRTAMGLTTEELRHFPDVGEPDRIEGDRWLYHRRTEDAAGRRAEWVVVRFINGRVAEVYFR